MHRCSPEVIPEEISHWRCGSQVLVFLDSWWIVKNKPTWQRVMVAHQHCGEHNPGKQVRSVHAASLSSPEKTTCRCYIPGIPTLLTGFSTIKVQLFHTASYSLPEKTTTQAKSWLWARRRCWRKLNLANPRRNPTHWQLKYIFLPGFNTRQWRETASSQWQCLRPLGYLGSPSS